VQAAGQSALGCSISIPIAVNIFPPTLLTSTTAPASEQICRVIILSINLDQQILNFEFQNFSGEEANMSPGENLICQRFASISIWQMLLYNILYIVNLGRINK